MKSLTKNVDQWSSEEKDALLASIVESSEDAIISKTLQGVITSWNKSAEKLFGYAETEILGQLIQVLIPEDRLREEEMIIQEIAAGRKVSHFKTVRKTKRGDLIDISLTISPIHNSTGEVVGASKIARNISEQIQLERELQATNLELQRLMIYKDEFVGLVAHELNTPLTTIIACLQMSADLPEHRELLITKANRQAQKLKNLLSQLLDVARSQSGRFELSKSVNDLETLVRDSIDTVQHTATKHKIEFFSPARPVSFVADAMRLEQVITNVLTNAIKYSPDGGRILVTASIEDENIKITVRDFGNGIPQPHLENIFNRFYRIKNTETSKASGLGMGLHIARQIMALHNGKIWAESEMNRGSTFVITLPLDKQS